MSSESITLLRKAALRRRLGGIAASTLHDWLSPSSPRHDPTMPRPIQLGANTVAWVEAEVDEWLANKVATAKKNAPGSR
jgi:prophage regulatory protein